MNYRVALSKLENDPNFKLIGSNKGGGYSWFRFEGPEENRAKDTRRQIVTFCFGPNGTDNRVRRSYRKTQKFFCVNGPLKNKWTTGSVGYMVFNAASGGNRTYGGKHVQGPSAVLVHLPSIKEPK